MPEGLKNAIRDMAAELANNQRLLGFLDGVEYALETMGNKVLSLEEVRATVEELSAMAGSNARVIGFLEGLEYALRILGSKVPALMEGGGEGE